MGETVSAKAYVTGAVVAVYGREGSDGEFLVQHILEPGLPPQEPLLSHRTSGEDKYVALVSDGEFVLARLILSSFNFLLTTLQDMWEMRRHTASHNLSCLCS